jgi:hypothetical protein
MPNIALIALDLDNTMLTNDKQISAPTKYWINRAHKAGITVIFTTGRGIQTTQHLWEELELETPMVLVNGAEIWKRPGELMERHILASEDVRDLVKFAEANGARFWGYSVESLSHSRDWSEAMYEQSWLKFGIRHNDLEVINRLRDEVRSWGRFEVTQSHPVNMEISCPGISKAYGLKKVCEYLHIDLNQVMAVGDSHNDYKMLQAAGLGVAMANASPEIKAIADVHTASNEEDGVAKAIQRYVFQEQLGVS